MNPCKVTIITPSYNSVKYFKETYLSVCSQVYKNFEWIIIDDCSTDGSFEFISKLIENDINIKLIKLDKNSGSAFARNKGLSIANGEYITFLDADDLLDFNYLEEQVKFIEKHGPIITSGYRRITTNSSSDFIPRKHLSYQDLLIGNDASCLTTMYSKKIIGDVYFPENLKKHEDFIFWLNILKKGFCIETNQKILASYRILKTSKNGNKKKLIKPMFDIYHKYLRFNIFKSLYYLCRWSLYGLKKYKNVK